MSKVILETEKCLKCGTCWAMCPDVFEPGENDSSHLKNAKPSEQEEIETQADCAKEAADVCPAQCIKIE